MKPFKRADRVAVEIQKVLSDLLRKDIKDPRLTIVTITGVKVTQDLRLAYIYFTVSGTSGQNRQPKEAEEGFKRALGFIKRTLASELGLRYMPDLRFFYDESIEYGSKIDSILKTIEAENEECNQGIRKE